MKLILGINAHHADSSACLIEDGKVIAAIEEERINRIKHFSGYPIEAIKECLRLGKRKDLDITDIAFNTKPLSNIVPKAYFYLKNFSIKKNQFSNRFSKKIFIKKTLFDNFNLNNSVKFHYVEHHLAHLASAYFPSGFKKAVALSIDGSGDFVTFALANCKNGKINIFKKILFPDSLGIFYHAMTQFLGFKNYGDEYKLMGLSAYGSPIYFEKILSNIFEEDKKNIFKLNLKFFNHQKKGFRYIADENLIIDQIFNKNLDELFKIELEKDKNQFLKDMASSVQKIYEYFFKKILNQITNYKISKNIVFAGGCALNSSANKILTEKNSDFDNIFIPFAPGDNGGCLGAAFVVSSKYNLELKNLKTPYLGNEFSKNELSDILNKYNLKGKISFELLKNDETLYASAAKLIADGNVIGWFQGKMEFGPRALGNRSILADPRNPNMKDIINMKIKRRESFRPFAPSVLSKFQKDWFEGNFDNPYMSSLATVKKNKRSLVPAITHIDGTARIQSVDSKNNQRYSSLLDFFFKLTGVPILLNTSFNENEPIVFKPEHALDCLLRTDMDAIFLDNYIVKRK